MHLTIRADGGEDIGFGHLARTSALACEALSADVRVTYATTSPEAVRQVAPDDVEITTLATRGSPLSFERWLREERPDAVIADAYPVDTAYQRAVRRHAALAILADHDRHAVAADLLVNANLYAPDLNYRYEDDPPRELLGPKYAPLREPIADLAGRAPPWREDPERTIITMGGSDVQELTPTIVRAHDGLDVTLDAVVGPYFSTRLEQEIREVAQEVSPEVRVVRNPDDLPERMFEADLAITTASSTIYELFALGTPMVCCSVAENQRPIAQALRDRDAASVVDAIDAMSAFEAAIEADLQDPNLRRRRLEQGRELVDGRGAERVLGEVLSLVDDKAGP